MEPAEGAGPGSLRIDWFDGAVSQAPPRPAPGASPCPCPCPSPRQERKLMGFRRLRELAQAEPAQVALVLSGRSSFWELIETELAGDYIVLAARVLGRVADPGGAGDALARSLLARAARSTFLRTLACYAADLPDTRISEKRMNSEFWNDIDGFFVHVLSFCRAVCKYIPELADETVTPLVNVVQMSIDGLIAEHRETFSDEVYQMIDDVEMDLSNLKLKKINLRSQPGTSTGSAKPSPRCEFRTMSIFPLHDDLTRPDRCVLEGNLIDGAYQSVEHYLDVQFRLMREDYIAPLREGILKYLQDPSKRRHDNIRIHPEVVFKRTHVANSKVGYLIDLQPKDRSNGDYYRGPLNKNHLMYGSLVLFTADNFETVLCGTVMDFSERLLREGLVAVSLHESTSSILFNKKFLMIESEVYFEPYHQVLKVLQQLEERDFPMKEYIVDVQPIIKPPAYLSTKTKYKLSDEDSEEFFVPVLQEESWPSSKDLGFDKSQYLAYKLALTREFAVIQGPPGTGKTYIGMQIAKTLLNNLTLAGNPILIICYTNHALDQFLEEILNISQDIVRLGSQSKSEKLEPYSLSNVRARSQSKHSYVYNSKKKQQDNIMKQMKAAQDGIEKCEKEIVSYKTVKQFLKIGNKSYKLDTGEEDPISAWLFAHLNEKSDSNNRTANVDNDELGSWDDDADDKVVDSCFSVPWALKEIESMKTSIKYVNDATPDSNEAKKMVDMFEFRIEILHKRINYFQNYFYRHLIDHKRYVPSKQVKSLYELSVQERWAMYFAAVRIVKENLVMDMAKLEKQHNEISSQLEEVRLLVDVESVRRARVLGATTTAAARQHELIRALNSHIVIVEEAAEVLEAHIVASLTRNCQHLVLIGDHQQLRPTAADYRIAREQNLEVSLFERAIINKLHSCTLTTQHRMTPRLLRLISPVIYDGLESHPDVLRFPKVVGMKESLFFLKHKVLEDHMGEDSWSHRNGYEAGWALALAEHLRRQEYAPEDIVLLTTYTAQAELFRQMSEGRPLLTGVKMTVVDNYQGEESRIVILSLVRSNREGSIGFLANKNRICVALSRARIGFYVIGNLEQLTRRSELWCRVREVLEEENAVGDSITIKCRNHADTDTKVTTSEGWLALSPHGGCMQRCGGRLPCGHRCSVTCHAYDTQHRAFVCDAPCERMCVNGHACPLRCGEPCGRCSARYEHTLSCGHRQEVPCFAYADPPTCLAVVAHTLPCGHQVEKNCYLDPRKMKCRICTTSSKARMKERP